MSKRKSKHRRRSFPTANTGAPKKPKLITPASALTLDEYPQPKHRDGIEQLIIAIILAVLFRSFEAEAFIIPTGSMAPTLQGKHKDVKCPQCGYRFRTGVANGELSMVTCPSCNYDLELFSRRNETPTFSGDRILVNKFAYQFGDPERWDVIVFKNPTNAKQNYIKRLVGLPNETIRIKHGNVFAKPQGENTFEILRKPPHKVKAMLQMVHDTDYISPALAASAWPARWFDPEGGGEGWEMSEDRGRYTLKAGADTKWLHYQNLIPNELDWKKIKAGTVDPNEARPQLITDEYAYNLADGHRIYSGWHWVGDLAVETDVKIASGTGTLLVELIEAGHHFTATFDLASDEVTLQMNDGAAPFLNGATTLTGDRGIGGAGRYKIMFANVDDRLLLWINNRLVKWNADGQANVEASYALDTTLPSFTASDPGDMNPVRIGGNNVDLEVTRLKVLRDIYYIACSSSNPHLAVDYDWERRLSPETLRDQVANMMRDPAQWTREGLFGLRDVVEFTMEDDQFFPMGDNAPRSQDARLWGGLKTRAGGKPFPPDYPDAHKVVGHFVPRSQMIGKAFLIYWPHGWPILGGKLPIIPNVQRMGRIR
ncbi:MAG: signal peptidase I [Planctomycetota bacterium]